MSTQISSLSDVHPSARIGDDVEIGPFCFVGPDVTIGNGTQLISHVALQGKVIIGERNRFWPNCVIGGEPQDVSFRSDADTGVRIGNDNLFREGVTVSRGAEKEDHWTRIDNGNMLMANAHVAHNCHIFDNTFLVNGVLLGGHVHVQDRAIVSGNSVVHHFATIGRLAFVSGGCRVPTDIPPFMLACGSDNPSIRTINLIGMRRAGISESTIRTVKRAHRLVFREHKRIAEVRDIFDSELEGVIPLELDVLLTAIERQIAGKQGRARETVRDVPPDESAESRAA